MRLGALLLQNRIQIEVRGEMKLPRPRNCLALHRRRRLGLNGPESSLKCNRMTLAGKRTNLPTWHSWCHSLQTSRLQGRRPYLGTMCSIFARRAPWKHPSGAARLLGLPECKSPFESFVSTKLPLFQGGGAWLHQLQVNLTYFFSSGRFSVASRQT